MTRDPFTAFGFFILALLRRRPAPIATAPADPLAELRQALERQIESDERARKRWGDNG